jgi:hypothetical protein
MMRYVHTLICGLFLFLGSVSGQDRESGAGPREAENLDKRLASLERRLDSLMNEVRKLREDIQSHSKMRIVLVKHVDAEQVGQVLHEYYGSHSGVLIEVLPKMKAIAIRADEKMKQEIAELINRLDDSVQSRVSGAESKSCPLIQPDPAKAEELIRKIRSLKPPEKK